MAEVAGNHEVGAPLGMSLSYLFPDREYGFQLGLRKGDAVRFFSPSAQSEEVLRERRHWLQTTPDHCVALMPDADHLIEETIQLASATSNFPMDAKTLPATAWNRCIELGQFWEPDFLILRREPSGQLILKAGVVCFPSTWSLAEKVGRPIEEIHEVVPGLNSLLGSQIAVFLSKLRPGTTWERQNWGLSRSPDLNQHPSQNLARLDATVDLNEVWLRLEEQILLPLPKTGGVLFGIRILVHSLNEIKNDAMAAAGLERALASMPEEVAIYKNLALCRARLIQLLQEAAPSKRGP